VFLDLLDNLGSSELLIVCVAGLLVFGSRLMESALGLLDRWLGQ
jgi:Sec-independent protein translocase protein TatA